MWHATWATGLVHPLSLTREHHRGLQVPVKVRVDHLGQLPAHRGLLHVPVAVSACTEAGLDLLRGAANGDHGGQELLEVRLRVHVARSDATLGLVDTGAHGVLEVLDQAVDHRVQRKRWLRRAD